MNECAYTLMLSVRRVLSKNKCTCKLGMSFEPAKLVNNFFIVYAPLLNHLRGYSLG